MKTELASATLTHKMGGLFIVGLLWGTTTPFLKQASLNVPAKETEGDSFIKGIARRIINLFRNPQFLCPYTINQIGSLGFYYLLSSYDITIVVPAANCLAFFFTFVTEAIIHKIFPENQSIVGCFFILIGLYMCMLSNHFAPPKLVQ